MMTMIILHNVAVPNEVVLLLPKGTVFSVSINETHRSDKHSTVKSLIGYRLCAVRFDLVSFCENAV